MFWGLIIASPQAFCGLWGLESFSQVEVYILQQFVRRDNYNGIM